MVVVISRSIPVLLRVVRLLMMILTMMSVFLRTRRISHSHADAAAATFARYNKHCRRGARSRRSNPLGWSKRLLATTRVDGSGKQQHNRAHRIRALSSTTTTTTTTTAVVVSVSTGNENPTLDWKGNNSHSTASSFATHVLIQPDDESPVTAVTVVQRVLNKLRQDDDNASRVVTDLSASALVSLGSVWYLAADAPRDPAAGVKPTRIMLLPSQWLYTGDYLRIHHDPRRFPAVHQYDWSVPSIHLGGYDDETTDSSANNKMPSVVVDCNMEKGWLVIDKPAGVPVHMTVDNALENVAACISAALTAQRAHNTSDVYVATPQRLDQNTSGLLVVATSKRFAAYFAQLLRGKTAASLEPTLRDGPDSVETRPNDPGATAGGSGGGGVHKLYKCLVCCLPPSNDNEKQPWSVQAAAKHLQSYVDNDVVMRHYLEPSIRAPKRFVDVIPDHVIEPKSNSGSKSSRNQTLPATGTKLVAAQWAESLLRIRRVSPVYALAGNSAATDLAQALRASSGIPDTCRAVLELDIELLTGRTHQIRGQLAASHYPIVGDVQYGGAQALPMTDACSVESLNERLALQCCQLEFLDPDHAIDKNGEATLIRSNRWNRFRIDQAWWTPLLQAYDTKMTQIAPDQATTSSDDDAVTTTSETAKALLPRSDLLPPRVSLSPGKHKYVLLRAEHPSAPNTAVEWFVKSAAPHECGGPYHGA
jgi:Tfp pilus assembly major pilin PilA